MLTAGGQKQHLYVSPYRGYMSSMDDRAQFGLGRASRVDTLEVVWPDGRRQVLTNLEADRLLVLNHADAAVPLPAAAPVPARRLFEPLDAGRLGALAYKHQVGALIDYGVQPLLPYLISRQGPALAVADVDGDGLDDVFVAGGPPQPRPAGCSSRRRTAASSPGRNSPGRPTRGTRTGAPCSSTPTETACPTCTSRAAATTSRRSSRWLQDRLYINQGGGRFARDTGALPAMLTSTATVRAGDFTGDGRPDLFVGGRLAPRNYPYPARSYLLRNEGGRFTDVTAELAPELANPMGMITDAVWIDFDGDRRLDLVTAGEWMSLQVLSQRWATAYGRDQRDAPAADARLVVQPRGRQTSTTMAGPISSPGTWA